MPLPFRGGGGGEVATTHYYFLAHAHVPPRPLSFSFFPSPQTLEMSPIVDSLERPRWFPLHMAPSSPLTKKTHLVGTDVFAHALLAPSWCDSSTCKYLLTGVRDSVLTPARFKKRKEMKSKR